MVRTDKKKKQPEDVYIYITPNSRIRYSIKSIATSLFPQDSIQKILLALTSRIAESHLIHEKRRILSMYRLFVLLLLKDLAQGLGNNWAFFIRDVIHSLLRIINEEKELEKRPRQHTQEIQLVVDSDLFLPCCNLLYYVCKAAVECCSQVRWTLVLFNIFHTTQEHKPGLKRLCHGSPVHFV